MDNPAECRVCFTIFTTKQRPRTLPCGHTFCSPCITNLLHQGTRHLTCPTCRVHHPAPDATHFPVNYGMEALIQQMQCLVQQRGVPAGVEEVEVKGGEEVKDGVNAEVEELKARVINLILDCSTVKTQIQQNQEKLLKPQARHTSLLTRLCNLVSENKGAMTQLMEAEEEYSSLISEGEDIMGYLQASVDQLETVTLMQQRRSAIYLTNSRVKEMEKWKKKFEEMKVGDEALDVSIKVLTATQEAVNTLARDGVDSEEADTTTTTTQVSAVLDRAHHSMQQLPQSPITLTTKDLLILGTDMRRLLKARLVYGLHQETTDALCSSRLTLENGQFHLYHLAQRTPPYRAHTIQVTGYLSAPHPSLLVFLDLAWGGQVKGRVYIRLHLDTPLAKQFLLLCCGRQGHTYAGSALLKVCGLRSKGEFIMGGDYDGSGGAPLVYDPYGAYRKTGSAGSVWGRFEVGDHRAAQFAITTRDCQGSIPRVFGCVEDGLVVVRAAVSALQEEPVCVEECGVVLNL